MADRQAARGQAGKNIYAAAKSLLNPKWFYTHSYKVDYEKTTTVESTLPQIRRKHKKVTHFLFWIGLKQSAQCFTLSAAPHTLHPVNTDLPAWPQHESLARSSYFNLLSFLSIMAATRSHLHSSCGSTGLNFHPSMVTERPAALFNYSDRKEKLRVTTMTFVPNLSCQ